MNNEEKTQGADSNRNEGAPCGPNCGCGPDCRCGEACVCTPAARCTDD